MLEGHIVVVKDRIAALEGCTVVLRGLEFLFHCFCHTHATLPEEPGFHSMYTTLSEPGYHHRHINLSKESSYHPRYSSLFHELGYHLRCI